MKRIRTGVWRESDRVSGLDSVSPYSLVLTPLGKGTESVFTAKVSSWGIRSETVSGRLRLVRFVCHRGNLQGLIYEIRDGRSTLGRDPACDFVIEDPKVSRVHAFLDRENGALVLTDNHSTNGSYINGRKLKAGAPELLTVNDAIVLGGCEYRVQASPQTTTVRFSESQPMVTGIVQSESIRQSIDDVFDYYRKRPDRPPTPEDTPGQAKLRKMMRSLETLYRMSRRISQVMPLDQLFQEMRDMLFDVFEEVENIVFLIKDSESGEYVPRLVANKHDESGGPVVISQSVFHRAMVDRVVIVANDAPSDERFSQSDSIVGLAIRSLMCAPLLLGDRVLGGLYVDNRNQGRVFDKSDAELLSAFAAQAAVAIDNARLYDVLQRSYHQTLQALVNTIEAKDAYTSGHSQRVAHYVEEIGRELGLTPERLSLLRTAAELHDIGKIGIKEMIINKTGKLSDSEFEEIMGHTVKGESIIRPIQYLEPILPAIRSHHEWWNGEGYPDGLRGEEISLEARILGVADAFDAMTTQRAYNQPLTRREACSQIESMGGTQFDPRVVEAFRRYVNRVTEDREDTS